MPAPGKKALPPSPVAAGGPLSPAEATHLADLALSNAAMRQLRRAISTTCNTLATADAGVHPDLLANVAADLAETCITIKARIRASLARRAACSSPRKT
jgi:hypothetical protein